MSSARPGYATHANGRYVPTMAELDVIARARLHAERMGGALKAGQAIYVSADTLATMNRWPHDARGVGFTGRDDGWYWQGLPVRSAP